MFHSRSGRIKIKYCSLCNEPGHWPSTVNGYHKIATRLIPQCSQMASFTSNYFKVSGTPKTLYVCNKTNCLQYVSLTPFIWDNEKTATKNN